jgi:hypothetical protein
MTVPPWVRSGARRRPAGTDGARGNARGAARRTPAGVKAGLPVRLRRVIPRALAPAHRAPALSLHPPGRVSRAGSRALTARSY